MATLLSAEAGGAYKPSWYTWSRFRLLPDFGYRPGDRYNTSQWWFAWLLLRVWTNIGVQFGVSVELDDQDLELRINLPWLHVRLAVPVFPSKLHQKFWRTKHPKES